MRCRYRSLQSDSSLRCCGFIKPQASHAELIRNYSCRPLWDALHNFWRAMRSSFELSASRTSIHFGGTDGEAGQCRQYHLAHEVSRRSGGAKLPSGWQGQQYFETGHWVRDVTGVWITAVRPKPRILGGDITGSNRCDAAGDESSGPTRRAFLARASQKVCRSVVLRLDYITPVLHGVSLLAMTRFSCTSPSNVKWVSPWSA